MDKIVFYLGKMNLDSRTKLTAIKASTFKDNILFVHYTI